ncbi:MAG: Uma2 family endonuclease [Planctomycetes bacterium]|nr:Uma2 family endonuclease [Planctomycetota bacterium]
MASATLTRRRAALSTDVPNGQTTECFGDDASEAFFMPDGSMRLDEFRQWTYSDDFPVATWEAFRSGRLRFIPTADGDDYIELEGSPDWILEIVSPSSVLKGKKKLRKRYHKAGVREYWLIDARGDEVDFQI